MQGNQFDVLMNQLEEAYRKNDLTEINRINALVMNGLEITISESALDYELIESLRGKVVYKNLVKLINENSLAKHDTLKLISSLITHLIIESEVRSKDLKNYPITILIDVLRKAVVDEGKIEDAQKFLRDRYSRFI